MRKIKFRAWWKHTEYNPDGKMYFVGGMTFATRQDGEPEFDDCGTPKEIGLMSTINNSKIGWNSVDECILMQYTGLKDKKGVEIYEGDIVNWGKKINGDVYYSNGRYWVRDFYQAYQDETTDAFGEGLATLEVVGNIYQNPGLLKLY